ncbi:MAG: DUF6351 family protein [Gammaproteobacteria bacterium]
MMLSKQFYISAGIVLALIIISLLFLFTKEDHLATKVIGLPGEYQIHQAYPPYSGPHPSTLQRPEETFPFPIKPGQPGPIQPLFAGPLQYPYVCRTEQAGLGQPLIDNQQAAGIAIYEMDGDRKTDKILGYSKDCSLATRIHYYYKRMNDENFYPIEHANDDIEQILIQGKPQDFIVRVETGTINRHPYIIYLLKGSHDQALKADTRFWNRKLIYQFRGGVGIGKIQGRLQIAKLLNRRKTELLQGYAVIHSTANQTSNHYDIWLSEDTALRLKRQFISQYGEPEYTVGLGGSGGAIQQYLLAQNNPSILDAAVALYSYPDMITKTPHVLDCELLEYFFDVTDVDNPRWSDWNQRKFIEGMNTLNGQINKYTWVNALANLVTAKSIRISAGNSECIQAWRGLSPLILNPRYPLLLDKISAPILQQSQLNYWDSMRYIYGSSDDGLTHVTWDNVGVQYGLIALKQQRISIQEFLKLNASVGGWKKPGDMQAEAFWFLGDNPTLNPKGFSVWSEHNMVLSYDPIKQPAPRTEGYLPAIQAAYRSGQVFLGYLNIPLIDLRHYREEELDMHHTVASFSSRARISKAQKSIGNQVIWMTHQPHTPTPEALAAIDRWMQQIHANPAASVADNKPKDIIDSCFDAKGRLIARGEHVWDGPWNQKPAGECYKTYPPFSTSRMMAGEDITGSILKCQLQTIAQAITSGLYQAIDMGPYQSELEKIFPQGVCDYSKADMGLPDDLLSRH